jgi:hypothetical protein
VFLILCSINFIEGCGGVLSLDLPPLCSQFVTGEDIVIIRVMPHAVSVAQQVRTILSSSTSFIFLFFVNTVMLSLSFHEKLLNLYRISTVRIKLTSFCF